MRIAAIVDERWRAFILHSLARTGRLDVFLQARAIRALVEDDASGKFWQSTLNEKDVIGHDGKTFCSEQFHWNSLIWKSVTQEQSIAIASRHVASSQGKRWIERW